MASKLLLLRRLSRSMKLSLAFPSSNSYSLGYGSRLLPLKASQILGFLENIHLPPSSTLSRSFCSRSVNVEGPSAIDYRSILHEDEYHRLADTTIHDLQEKLEVYGDSVEVDGFDIDYGMRKKVAERGLQNSANGPSRFDWDQEAKAWIYRRNKANLYKVLEDELRKLCGKPIVLS